MSEHIEPSLIKSAPAKAKEPPGLFHVIVETADGGQDIYLLLPVTNRMMPLDIVTDKSRFETLEDLATAIDLLPENTEVYTAKPEVFFAGKKNIRCLRNSEIAKLRQQLERKKR